MDRRIKLNVGGRIHMTTASTLLKYPETLLARMIVNSEIAKLDEDGSYFFDRNPDLFSFILDFYRTDAVVYPTFVTKENFLSEMEFWGIEITIEEFPSIEDVINFDLFSFEVQFLTIWPDRDTIFTYYDLFNNILHLIKCKKRTGIISVHLTSDGMKKLKQIFNFKNLFTCLLWAEYHKEGKFWVAFDKIENVEIRTQVEQEILDRDQYPKIKCLRFEF